LTVAAAMMRVPAARPAKAAASGVTPPRSVPGAHAGGSRSAVSRNSRRIGSDHCRVRTSNNPDGSALAQLVAIVPVSRKTRYACTSQNVAVRS